MIKYADFYSRDLGLCFSHVGLCRVSELSDNHIDDLLAEFKAGERVTAKVLKRLQRRCCRVGQGKSQGNASGGGHDGQGGMGCYENSCIEGGATYGNADLPCKMGS